MIERRRYQPPVVADATGAPVKTKRKKRKANRRRLTETSVLTLPVSKAQHFVWDKGTEAARGFDDHEFALQMLEEEDVLIVPGTSFNVPYRDHFRVTLLPEAAMLREVFTRIDRVLARRAVASTGTRSAVA